MHTNIIETKVPDLKTIHNIVSPRHMNNDANNIHEYLDKFFLFFMIFIFMD